MKIVYCIINTWYSGGLTRVLANKTAALVAMGHDVTVITTDQFGKDHHYSMAEKINFIDLNINYVEHDQKSVFKKAFLIPWKIYQHKKRLSKVLKDLKADIVISLFYKDIFMLPSIKDGSKKILEAHSSRYTWIHSREERGIISKIQNLLDLFLIKRFDRFIVLTYEDLPHWGNLDNIEVIPNANTFDSDVLSTLDNKKVIAVGRYDYQKNFEGLLDVWKLVVDKCPDWSLDIIGDGVYKELLERKIHDLKIHSSVSLVPTTQNIKNHYINSSIYVLTSRYEGLGMVLLEAQSCGVPLVSYDCQCGPKDIIDDGQNGFLIPFENKEKMAEKLIYLMNNELVRKEMGKKAKIYSKNFSEEKIMNKWIELFTKLKAN